MSRRALIAACVLALVTAAASLVLAANGGGAPPAKPPTAAEKKRLQDRIGRQIDSLARQGVYVEATGRGKPCVSVHLANPTRPNIDDIRRRYGQVCVSQEPMARAMACTGYTPPPPPTGPVTVPDLQDLGLYEATRRATAAGLTYTLNCLGDRETKAKRPSRYSPDALARVVDQCPRPGERVTAGTDVALEGTAVLPGGFEYGVGGLNGYTTGTATAFNKLRVKLRRSGDVREYFAVVETTQAGAPHLHVLATGRYIPQKRFSKARRVGGVRSGGRHPRGDDDRRRDGWRLPGQGARGLRDEGQRREACGERCPPHASCPDEPRLYPGGMAEAEREVGRRIAEELSFTPDPGPWLFVVKGGDGTLRVRGAGRRRARRWPTGTR